MRSTFRIHTTSKTSESRKFVRAPNSRKYKSYELSFDMSDKERLAIHFILFGQSPDYLSIVLFL